MRLNAITDHPYMRRVYSDMTPCGKSCGRCGAQLREHAAFDVDQFVDVGDPRMNIFHPKHREWLTESPTHSPHDKASQTLLKETPFPREAGE